MESDQQDILVELSIENLEELIKFYEKYRNESPIPYSFLKSAIRYQKNGADNSKVFSIRNSCWREHGTIIGIYYTSKVDCNVYLYTMEKSGKSIVEGVSKTERILYPKKEENGITWFSAIPLELSEKVGKFLVEEKQFTIMENISEPAVVYGLGIEDAEKLKLTIPEEIHVKKLAVTDAAIIESYRLYKTKEGVMVTENDIRMNGGIGLYLKSNDNLVAWTYFSNKGSLQQVFTIEAHRRKGYGTLVLHCAAKHVAENEDYPCWATVRRSNEPSRKMFEKAGFKIIGEADFLAVQK